MTLFEELLMMMSIINDVGEDIVGKQFCERKNKLFTEWHFPPVQQKELKSETND